MFVVLLRAFSHFVVVGVRGTNSSKMQLGAGGVERQLRATRSRLSPAFGWRRQYPGSSLNCQLIAYAEAPTTSLFYFARVLLQTGLTNPGRSAQAGQAALACGPSKAFACVLHSAANACSR